MQRFVMTVIFLLLVYIAYQAKVFDGAIEYFTQLSKHNDREEIVIDEWGNTVTVEHKSIMQRLQDMKKGNE